MKTTTRTLAAAVALLIFGGPFTADAFARGGHVYQGAAPWFTPLIQLGALVLIVGVALWWKQRN